MHWFEFYAKEFAAPVYGIHSPNHLPEILDHHIEDVVSQFKGLISLLEKISGLKFSHEKLSEALSLSSEATLLWREFLNLGKSKPSPFNFFDSTIEMGPIVVLRGTEIARDDYKFLLESTNTKINEVFSTVPNENLRIYWDGMPVWGRLRRQSEFFKRNNSSVVASTYCNSWIFSSFDLENPLKSMALAYLEIFINRNDAFKENYIEKLVKEFDIDGVIFHDSKTCPNNSNSQYNLPNKLRAKNIPSVVIDGDLCDLRCYSDEQAEAQMEAFLESLQ
jgi:benzoyl-CoA reductase/2-hydroxyglutaryl-CoA dehydratase subunit BcrC/BadD/HgdB